MSNVISKREKRERRHKRVRAKIKGTAAIPRLSVFRSNRHLQAQLIDDIAGRTLVAAGDYEVNARGKKIERGESVGKLIAEKAKSEHITLAVFDRGGYAYNGVVEAVAEGARKGGLKF